MMGKGPGFLGDLCVVEPGIRIKNDVAEVKKLVGKFGNVFLEIECSGVWGVKPSGAMQESCRCWSLAEAAFRSRGWGWTRKRFLAEGHVARAKAKLFTDGQGEGLALQFANEQAAWIDPSLDSRGSCEVN